MLNKNNQNLIEDAYTFLINLNNNLKVIEGKNNAILDNLTNKYKTIPYYTQGENRLLQEYYNDRLNTMNTVINLLYPEKGYCIAPRLYTRGLPFICSYRMGLKRNSCIRL